MPGDQPFAPLIAATVGKSTTLTISVTNQGTMVSTTSAMATNVLVTNGAGVTLFVRMSTEATPVATSLDVPLASGASRLFANPAPIGTTGVAVTATVTGGTAQGLVTFTPGNAGVE